MRHQNIFEVEHFRPLIEADAIYLPNSMDSLIDTLDKTIAGVSSKITNARSVRKQLMPDINTPVAIAEALKTL